MGPTQVARLSPQERLALIQQLWDSLDDADVAVTPAQQAELDRRLAARDEGRETAIPWAELRRELHQRHGK
jgi:putative addiction module component (TIGR02574 family)